MSMNYTKTPISFYAIQSLHKKSFLRRQESMSMNNTKTPISFYAIQSLHKKSFLRGAGIHEYE